MKRTGRTIRTLTVAVAALMMTLVIPALALPASATPVAAAGPANAASQWAYGTEKWVNVTITLPNATYSAQSFFGWHVVFTATNTSNTSIELEVQRAMLATYHASLCSPNCSSPSLQGNLSVRGWEKNTAFANLTTSAQVFENGSAAAALGLLNASSQTSGNLTEALSVTTAFGGASHTASANFDLAGHASSSIAFAPALGLVPWNLTSGLSWNATSAFTAQGAWSLAYAWTRTTFAGAHLSGGGNPSGNVNASGSVAIFGKDLGTITLNNGKTVPVIGLLVLGPFDDLDGVILVPHDFDIFGGMDHAYGHFVLAGEAIATSKVDLFVDAIHHRVIFEAAATTDGPQDASLVTAVGGSTASGPAAAPAGPAPTEFQAQPESVPTAQQASNCLVGSCPSSAASAASGWAFVLVIGLVIAAVLGTVSVVEYRAWRLRHGPLAEKPGTTGPIREATSAPPAGAYGPLPGTPTLPQPGEPPRPPFSP
jgi:hypothetical protein